MAGGIAAGSGAFETLLKECEEEASISAELASRARSIGTIRLVISITMYYATVG